jgi:hypothetical protein
LHAVETAVQLWNDSTAIWENKAGKIVSVVNIEHAHKEHSGWGEVFFQRHPDYEFLLPEMLAYVEEHLSNREKNLVYLPIYDYDEALIAAAETRGYQKNEKYTLWDSVYTVSRDIPRPTVPEGYRLRAMADTGSDIEKRRKAFGVGFNHPDPKDWPSRISYEGLQQAPDYRADLDIYVTSPDGEYVSFCIGWWDETNKIACLEPVGSAPEHRRKGLAAAAVFETIHQVADLGVERVFVGSDQAFYLAIGFELTLPAHHWVRNL